MALRKPGSYESGRPEIAIALHLFVTVSCTEIEENLSIDFGADTVSQRDRQT
jgi:hypothetical protein